MVQRVVDSLGLLGRKPDLARTADPAATFLQSVSVESVRNTRLVEIQVEDRDPKLAAEMANALASAYVHQNLELKLGAARDALTWLTTQVQDLKSKVNESELTLQRYREQSGLVRSRRSRASPPGSSPSSTAATSRRSPSVSKWRLGSGSFGRTAQNPELLESSPIVINNPLIQRLKGQLVELEVSRSKLLKTFRDKHPEVVKVQSQIDEISQKIREEVSRLSLSLESEYNALKARENAMAQAVNQYRDEAQGLAKKEIQYGILKREADSNQQLYDVLLKRLKETGLSQGLDSSNVRIVEPAVTPIRPVKPRKMLNLAVGIVLGLCTGLGLAFFVEYMDDTVHVPEHVEQVSACRSSLSSR